MAKEKVVTLENYGDNFMRVFPTEKNIYHRKNIPVMLHPDAAKRLIEKGLMTQETPDDYEAPEEDGSDES